ncbi:uncharacterized protein LOC142330254 isoform X2 [Lycorma delicatula]|uniref:uncharacterized protein LOC142330254 isoform X2 n=1 Tax=Lycorma delicatula TaxID=130591 RepID=UPI003F51547C
MDVPLKNIYTFEALSSNSIKLETEDDITSDCVAMDKGTIKGSTKNFITCKSINNSLNDGIISKTSSECNCAYGDVTVENLIENISSENKLLEQKGKKLVCEYCNERFRCNSYLKRHLNINTTEENYVCNFFKKSFNGEKRGGGKKVIGKEKDEKRQVVKEKMTSSSSKSS